MTKTILPVGVGLILLAIAAILGSRTRAFVRRAVAVPGVVEYLNADGSHPQIQFTTPEGVRISYPQGGLIFGYKPGQTVRVLFEQHDPAGTAQIDAFGALWFDSIGVSFVGVVCLLVGLTWMISHLSSRR